MRLILCFLGLFFISLSITLTMALNGYSPVSYFLTNLAVGAILGYVSSKAGYDV